MKVTDKYIFFLRGILSNWARIPGGISYTYINAAGFNRVVVPTSEHIFMLKKAELFHDWETFDKIIATDSPREAKRLGREVRNFSQEIWDKEKENAMYSALLLKSYSSREFIDVILRPEWKDKSFVEANPNDTIWAIGMSEDDPGINDPKNWKGENLLGKCLDRVRTKLIKNQWASEKREHTWIEDIIYCPSQIYYYFSTANGQKYVLYLRWRHQDPWTVELVKVNSEDEWDWDSAENLGYFKWTSEEWKYLEEEVLEILRKKFPDVSFPEHPDYTGDD